MVSVAARALSAGAVLVFAGGAIALGQPVNNAASAGPSAAPALGADSDAYSVRPLKRRAVGEVVVLESGLGEPSRKPIDEPESCTDFRPRAADIREFVRRAKSVSRHGFLHDSTWSVCHASGWLRLQGGARADWMVQRSGAGYLIIDGAYHYLDCPDCRWRPASRTRQR